MHYPIFELLEFIIFSSIFVVPSWFQKQVDEVTVPSLSKTSLITTGILLLILCLFILQYIMTARKLRKNAGPIELQEHIPFLNKTLRLSVISLFLFLILIANSHLFELLSRFFSGENAGPRVYASRKPVDVVFTICYVAVYASLEEFSFRWMLPHTLLSVLSFRKQKDKDVTLNSRTILIPRIVSEIIAACMFAFSHLYMGWFSVAHALVAGIILRVSFLKMRSIIPGCIAHTLLNLFSFYGILSW